MPTRCLVLSLLLVIGGGCSDRSLSKRSASDMSVAGVKLNPPTSHRPVAVVCANADAGATHSGGSGGGAGGGNDNDNSCSSDSDCPNGTACGCDVGYDACIFSGCRVDSDCGAGGYCSPTFSIYSCDGDTGLPQLLGFYCHTANDQCNNDSDCASDQYCSYDTKAWNCILLSCNS